ncbi:MAG: dihydrolipoyl dehydrogenase [Rickettsiales bacterium]|nr:dihydrolipoyl dehydrogenase [Pseudomonadota bacterium]MDA0966986.1 dihydrolipoyl dehydrogenase [Pseudomonadota bacterium]MDG4543906.1 dihydrolipoyl dehydrogenase [Rickettsiales bacterium]MDG4546052.1 dihydrolipoyl dehydrogenase [Rickettsiales bacterium]MDG4548298.1 dihydrolipoyl dehydrogenase [Rickettsiales bacterium]
MSDFDLVVIGGGPGGYVAAIKASQLGMKVACVEKRGTLGGTCLNVGCIPSKALLNSSHLYEEATHNFANHGIKASGLSIDVKKMQKHKDDIVEGLTKGIEGLFAKNKVKYFVGTGEITAKGEVTVKPAKGKSEKITAKNILIATGSEVANLPGVEIDGKKIVSSDHAIHLTEVPKKMVVIGGGVIGLELGSVWRRLGAEVTVVEYLDKILPPMDGEVSKTFQKILEKQGINFKLGSKVTSAKASAKGVELNVEPAKGGDAEKLSADVVLVAIGRKPYTEGLGLKEVGVKLDDRGRIETDGHFKTNIDGIWAIGDVIAGPMLAHKAEEDGVAAVEIMAGQAGHVDYDLVPSVIYTHPEVAMIGKTEEQLKEAGVSYNKGKFPFMANSRARTVDEKDGFVKILADKETDEVLGVHIIGPQAGTLIGEASVAMTYRASSEDIARICHSHPDLNEAIKEAALDTFFKPIHM